MFYNKVMDTKDFSAVTLMKHLGYLPALFLGLAPVGVLILAVFMVIDVITGILRSGFLKGWSSITSSRLVAGITAKGFTVLVPLLIVAAGHGAGVDLLIVAQSILGLLIFATLYSIIGNIHAIATGKDSREFDAINFILLRLRDFIEKRLQKENEKGDI